MMSTEQNLIVQRVHKTGVQFNMSYGYPNFISGCLCVKDNRSFSQNLEKINSNGQFLHEIVSHKRNRYRSHYGVNSHTGVNTGVTNEKTCAKLFSKIGKFEMKKINLKWMDNESVQQQKT